MRSKIKIEITQTTGLLAIAVNKETDAIELSREDVRVLKSKLKKINLENIASNEEII